MLFPLVLLERSWSLGTCYRKGNERTIRRATLANAGRRYWGDEEQTRAVMKKDEEGTLWMYTGDEGIMDEEGYLKS